MQHPPDVAIVNPKSNVILGRLRTNNKKLSKNIDADEGLLFFEYIRKTYTLWIRIFFLVVNCHNSLIKLMLQR